MQCGGDIDQALQILSQGSNQTAAPVDGTKKKKV